MHLLKSKGIPIFSCFYCQWSNIDAVEFTSTEINIPWELSLVMATTGWSSSISFPYRIWCPIIITGTPKYQHRVSSWVKEHQEIKGPSRSYTIDSYHKRRYQRPMREAMKSPLMARGQMLSSSRGDVKIREHRRRCHQTDEVQKSYILHEYI